jgi:hypothetical protein
MHKAHQLLANRRELHHDRRGRGLDLQFFKLAPFVQCVSSHAGTFGADSLREFVQGCYVCVVGRGLSTGESEVGLQI